jgi:exonuclease SbcD
VFKFIHAADIHLDSPLRNLAQYDGAPVEALRTATRQALENLVDLALREKVAFVLIAGDLYDGNWDSTQTGLHFADRMSRLREAGIPVYLIAGNHDAANKMTHKLRLPENVCYLSERQPQTIEVADVGVHIHGQGFARRDVLENLVLRYPAATPGCFNIGLLHTCATGTGHEPYAPCSLDDLRNKGYDYWALGHIHQREILCSEPLIAFSGNLQGRHIRETGPKGCWLVTVDSAQRATMEFRTLDVLRWEYCRVDAANCRTGDDVLDAFIAEMDHLRRQHVGVPLALRVEVFGASPAHQALAANPPKWVDEIRNAGNDRGEGDVWLEKVKLRTEPERNFDLAKLADGPLGELPALLAELLGDESRLKSLGAELADLERKLPGDLKSAEDALALDDPAMLRELVESIGPLLMARLSSEKVDA